MGVHPVVSLVDHLVQSQSDEDVRVTVQTMRRALEGTTLSSLVIHDLNDTPDDEIDRLRSQIIELNTVNASLEVEVENLRSRLQKIEEQPLSCGPSQNGVYTMEQFLSVLTAKMRRSYGWRTDYIIATHETPDCQPVANESIQKWQNSNKVPDWAVHQIDRLIFRKRGGNSAPTWSDEDEQYLTDLYKQDPRQRNRSLANNCEQHFGRTITENSIKGALDRLRKHGSLPKKRPSRMI